MRFTIRIYAYAGKLYLRVLHTVTFTANVRETEIEEIAVRVPVGLTGFRKRCLVSGDTPADISREIKDGGFLLSQATDYQYHIAGRDGEHTGRIAKGVGAAGYALIEDGQTRLAAGHKYMREEYPKPSVLTAPVRA